MQSMEHPWLMTKYRIGNYYQLINSYLKAYKVHTCPPEKYFRNNIKVELIAFKDPQNVNINDIDK